MTGLYDRPTTERQARRVYTVSNLYEEEIRNLAYQRFVRRGRKHGHDLDDWLAAEKEVLQYHDRPGCGVW